MATSKRGKKTAKGRSMPQEAEEQLRTAIAEFNDPALSGGTRGRFCYVTYGGEPLCRLGYRPDSELWDFAIYRFSTGTYSMSDPFMPSQNSITDGINIALHAYNLR